MKKIKKNPFKVDKVREIKIKTKAKKVATQLKRIQLAVRDKVTATDAALSLLKDVVRQSPQEKPPAQTDRPPAQPMDKAKEIEKFNKAVENEKTAMEKLEKMSCA